MRSIIPAEQARGELRNKAGHVKAHRQALRTSLRGTKTGTEEGQEKAPQAVETCGAPIALTPGFMSEGNAFERLPLHAHAGLSRPSAPVNKRGATAVGR